MGYGVSGGDRRDRGFTLIELVIVIAVLAILVGLLAPSYTKYVEKSRRAADMSNAKNIAKVVTMGIVDGSIEFKNEFYDNEKRNVICITVDSSGTHCSASGQVAFDGKTYGDVAANDNNYQRVTNYMKANGVENEKVRCGHKGNDGWGFYTVLVYSDGSVRYASGDNEEASKEYYDGDDGKLEIHANYWYTAPSSNIEKAMQGAS